MKCPRCQNENPPGSKFCLGCGTHLGTSCHACGNSLPAGSGFCNRCGAPVTSDLGRETGVATPAAYTPKHLAERILTSRAALEGERKQVTVLFADLKGSMELLADRDPEEARTILDPVLTLMMEAVHRYEGTVNQVMGDGIMALFGAPLAHEDHAVRACYAALRMQEAMKRYAEAARQGHGVNVQIRVGLHSGEVVVRAIGSDLHMDYTAVGQTTHLAARMEQLASPGSIVLTSATMELVEGLVAARSLGAVPVKGLAERVTVYELAAAGPALTRLQAAARRGLTRFVGRETEWEQLRRGQELTGAGHGQVTALVGEAGVGKSRLAYEFTHFARRQGWRVIEAAAASYGQATSYLPVIQLLQGYFQIDRRDDQQTVREKVTGKVLSLDRALDPSLSPLLSLLDVSLVDDAWTKLEPPERRLRTLEAIRRLLLRESLGQPLLLVFEDLHWIDSESRTVLESVIEGLPGARLLLLVTYRPEYQHTWGDKTYYTQIRIDPLPPTEVERFLETLLGQDRTLDQLRRLLMDRADGNPFFLEESVRALAETGRLVGQPGAYRLSQPLEDLHVPASIQALLAARIDRLSLEDKRLLQVAAVIGMDSSLGLLQEATDLAEDDLRHGVARLQAAELLYEARLFPDLEYSFKHALIHEVAYGALVQSRRRELHARIVQGIEHLYPDRQAEHVERLAYHAVRGGLWDKAVAYLREAGMRAAMRSAYREGLDAFEQALRALSELPESRALQAQAIDIRLDARAVLAPLGQYRRILEYMREAETFARQLGDQRRLGLVLADMGARLRNVGEHQRALAASREAMEIATDLGDTSLRVEATYRLAQTQFAVGDFGQATVLFEQTVRTLANESVSRSLPPFFLAWPRAWLALTFSHLGHFSEALDHAAEALRIAESVEHPHTLIEAHGAVGGVSLERGELPTAVRVFEKAIALSRARGVTDTNILSGLGHGYALSGRLSEALPLLEEAARSETSISAMASGQAVRMSRLAEAYLGAGRADEALERAHDAVELARAHDERANEAIGLRVLADILIRGARLEAPKAEECYAASLTVATELGMRPVVAHCHLGLGGLYRRVGDPERAREHIGQATSMYREMQMPYWLEHADLEFTKLG